MWQFSGQRMQGLSVWWFPAVHSVTSYFASGKSQRLYLLEGLINMWWPA